VRRIVPLLALCAGLAFASGSATAERGRPLLALVGNGTTESVAWFEGASLKPLAGRRQVYVGLHDIPHAFSPDPSLLALGSGRTSSLVVVDLSAMRLLDKLDTRFTSALAWLSARRLLLIEHAYGSLRARVIHVGPRGLRPVWGWPLPAHTSTLGVVSARGYVVLLLSPEGELGPARLAVVAADGVRTVTLDRIQAGWTSFDPAAPLSILRSSHPGLAVDAAGGRAFVVPGAGPVAEIHLSDLSVEYHSLEETAARRPADGGPGNGAPSEGVHRQAAWLGHGIVAVAGEDHRSEEGPDGLVQTTAPAGLRLVDTRTWSVRTLDDAAVSFTRSDGLLIGTSFGPGRFSVYDADGRLLSRSTLPPASGLQVAGAHAYVTLGNEYGRHRVRVVDLRTGATLRTVRVPGWFFPLSRSSPQLCWC
jgi:hypothetical protein